jgi:hypothetical protein
VAGEKPDYGHNSSLSSVSGAAGVTASLLLVVLLSAAGCGPSVEEKKGEARESYIPLFVKMVPAAGYCSLEASKPYEKFESHFFRLLSEKFPAAATWRDESVKEAERLGLELRQFSRKITVSSTDPGENLYYIEGDLDAGRLEGYARNVLNWEELEDVNLGSYTYRIDGRGHGYVPVGGGTLFASQEIIESTLSKKTAEREQLFQSEEFFRSMKLVDFDATEFSLRWCDLLEVKEKLKSEWRPLAEEPVIAALDEIEAVGYSYYWDGSFRAVKKIRFSRADTARTAGDFLGNSLAEITVRFPPDCLYWLHKLTRLNPDQLRMLAGEIQIFCIENILETRLSLTWEDLKKYLPEDATVMVPGAGESAEAPAESEEIKYDENIIVVLPGGGSREYLASVLDCWGNRRNFQRGTVHQLADYLSGIYSALRSQRPDSWYESPFYVLVSKDAPWEGFVDVWEEIRKLERELRQHIPDSVPVEQRELAVRIPSLEVTERAIERLREQGRLF